MLSDDVKDQPFFLLDIDRDKDGFISLSEFLGDYKDPDDKEAEEPEWVTEETKRFKEEYDKNHDGKLDKEEASLFLSFCSPLFRTCFTGLPNLSCVYVGFALQ